MEFIVYTSWALLTCPLGYGLVKRIKMISTPRELFYVNEFLVMSFDYHNSLIKSLFSFLSHVISQF
jgi:hypothetical protein